MLLSLKLSTLTENDDIPLKTYHDCLAQLTCNPSMPNCHLENCKACPGVITLKAHLLRLLNDIEIDNVTYKRWTAVDRSTLETISMPKDDFVDALCDKLEVLLMHSFIAKQQSHFYSESKSLLTSGVVIVCADFSENYAFVVQDAAQSFHWNNCQATVHPFVISYSDLSSIRHISFVVISDCLHHDTMAVYLFQKI